MRVIERKGVDGVVAIIVDKEMAAMNIHGAFIHKRVKASRHVLQGRRRVARILGGIGGFLLQDTIDLFEFTRHFRHFSRRGMTGLMNKTGERSLVWRTATLMVNAQGVSSRKCPRHHITDKKWERASQTRNAEPVFPRCFE